MSKTPTKVKKSKSPSVETAFANSVTVTSSSGILAPSDVPPMVVLPTNDIPTTIDRVNNITQKEESLYKAGVTRRKVYERIGELLNATKRVVGYDSRGMEVVSEEPDLGRRKEGAELAMRAFGDSKEFLAVNTQVNNVMDVKAIVEAIAKAGDRGGK